LVSRRRFGSAVLGHGLRASIVAFALVLCGFAVAVSSASAASFTWRGGAPAGEGKWSNPSNWVGGTTPSGSVETLAFPELTSSACTVLPRTAACYRSNNDVPGLEVNGLSIVDPLASFSEQEAPQYSITGNEISLGAGGLTVTRAGERFSTVFLGIPITLTAPQTWSIDGGEGGGGVGAGGQLKGSSPLEIRLAHFGGVELGTEPKLPDDEVGTVNVVGADSANSGANAFRNGFIHANKLNATDGNPVTVTDAGVGLEEVGPLSLKGAFFSMSRTTVVGAFSEDAATANNAFFRPSSSFAGMVEANGAVSVGGSLELVTIGEGPSSSVCGSEGLHVGETQTLVSTVGTLTGKYNGIENEQLVPVRANVADVAVKPLCGMARITYGAHAVTAKLVSLVSPPTPNSQPSITGSTYVGQTLTDVQASWTGVEETEISGLFQEWEDCDANGANCVAIPEAFGLSYVLTPSNVGHTIRLKETGSNGAGSAQATSAPTPVVQAASPGGGGGSTGGTPSPGGGTGGGGVLGTITSSPPTPIVGQRQTATVSSGTVTIRVTGTSTFMPLSGSTSIPDGSEVEATNGHVVITAATLKAGQTVSAEVYGGRFRIHQDAKGETHFILTLPLTGCPRATLPHGSAAAVSAKHRSGPRSRHLWVSETGGKWGTNGRYVSTSVEGTRWLTTDECNRSQVRVAAGKVVVDDLVRRKTKTLTAGKLYVAVLRGAHRA
jgi:hypothetical protein